MWWIIGHVDNFFNPVLFLFNFAASAQCFWYVLIILCKILLEINVFFKIYWLLYYSFGHFLYLVYIEKILSQFYNKIAQ